jgi:1-acyl-sn-glycerol-3-phosphate acyltransferase
MRLWYAFILALARGILRVIAPGTVRGAEHIPLSGSFILASNHFSFFEPPILAVSSPREIHFMAKKSLFGIPIFGSLIRSLNSIPINRGSADVAGLNQAVALLRGGEPLLIFPEGGRNKTGRLKGAKGGIGYLVLATGLPIIPAYVRNSNQILQCFLRKRKISVSFGPPLLPDPGWNNLERKEAHRRIGSAVMDRIAALEREALSRESARD